MLNEIKIYYSKSYSIIGIFMTLIILGLGFSSFYNTEINWLSAVLTIIGLYFSYENIKRIINKTPQIIFNTKGIRLPNQSFHEWSSLKKVYVNYLSGEDPTHELILIRKNNKTISLSLEPYSIDPEKLKNIIKSFQK